MVRMYFQILRNSNFLFLLASLKNEIFLGKFSSIVIQYLFWINLGEMKSHIFYQAEQVDSSVVFAQKLLFSAATGSS